MPLASLLSWSLRSAMPRIAAVARPRPGKALAMAVATGMALSLGLLSAACSVPPSAECEQYVACVAHTDAIFDLPGTNTTAYAPDGACWKDANTAAQCTEACQAALEDLRRALDLAGEPRGDCG